MMQRIKRIIQTTVLYGASLFLVAGIPISAYAESAPPPAQSAPDYTYNSDTQRWDTSKWHYNATTGSYEPTVAAVQQPPATVVVPEAPEASPTSEGTLGQVAGKSPSPTLPSPSSASETTASATIGTATAVANTVTSEAITGDAVVAQNTTAAHATTGDASASAMQTNIINSTVSAGAQTPVSFVSNVVGNVVGDIMLYPMMLAAMLHNAVSPSVPTTLKSMTDNTIVNNLTLHAASGAATVEGNTTAGSATTGSANAMASVMNIVNSMVAANQSFVGTVNIYGDLNGDILVAPDFIPQLLASNSATVQSKLTTSNTTGIINNISLAAGSGQASVAGNTTAGDATSGTASTNTVILNLTGHQIVASNSLLVFVNVLGTWVGMIVNAPVGTTAAALGDGVQNNTTTLAAQTPAVISSQTTNQITNTIDLSAQSGDAIVRNNTTAGDATTGNATASVAILNIANSTFGISNWFGVLFINVFGSWEGSFGIDTPNGNNPLKLINIPTSGGASLPQAAAFVAHIASPQPRTIVPFAPTRSTATTKLAAADMTPKVLGTAIDMGAPFVDTSTLSSRQNSGFPSVFALIVAGIGLAGASWMLIAAGRTK